MITDDFKAELHEILALDADTILDRRERPKKGQVLSNEEADHVNTVLKAYAANANRTPAEMLEMRDFVNVVRSFYRVDKRDNEEKGELVLTPTNYNRWAGDFENFNLLETETVEFTDPDPETTAEKSMEILGLTWN